MTRAIDWPGLMRAGLTQLGLTPTEFWRLSPVELKIMLGLETGMPVLNRARLEELAAAFPDIRTRKDDDAARDFGRPVGGP